VEKRILDPQLSTALADLKLQQTLNLARRYELDPDKPERHSRQQCLTCYYTPHISGRAFSPERCAGCQQHLQHPTTDIHKLCLMCARAHKLCTRCGADIDHNTSRKDWPVFNNKE
jgi:hypothetical protein